MATIIDGKAISAAIRAEIKEETEQFFKKKWHSPRLGGHYRR